MLVLFGAWKGPRGYLGLIWPLMRCLGPPETPLKSLQATTLAPSGSPGTLPKGGGSAREVPRTPSSNLIKFICLPRFAFWTANSSPHGLHERSRGRPMAEKAIKTNVFLTFSKSLKTLLGSPREHSQASSGALGDGKKKGGAPRRAARTPLGNFFEFL